MSNESNEESDSFPEASIAGFETTGFTQDTMRDEMFINRDRADNTPAIPEANPVMEHQTSALSRMFTSGITSLSRFYSRSEPSGSQV